MMPEETDYWDSIATQWEQSRSDRLWRKHSDATNESLLLRWLPEQPIPRLLKTDTFDEAVGFGLCRLLQTRARHVVGMDLSFRNVQSACRGDLPVHGACADVRILPFEDDSFDVVVSNSTLDHFQTLDEITVSLKELHRVLRQKGQLIVTMDNMANPMIAARNHLPFNFLYKMGIVPYFVGATCGPWRLQTLLREAGFHVRDVTAILHCPRILAVFMAKILYARGNPSAQTQFLHWLQKFERLARWPSRYFTGCFIAVCAEKGSREPSKLHDD